MKKKILLSGIFVSGILLFACSQKENSDNTPPAEEPAEFSIDTADAIGKDTAATTLDSLGVNKTRKDNTSTDTKGNNKKAAE